VLATTNDVMTDKLSLIQRQFPIVRHGFLLCISRGEHTSSRKVSNDEFVFVVMNIATLVQSHSGLRWWTERKYLFPRFFCVVLAVRATLSWPCIS